MARKTSLVLSGGIALGVYQAGAYEVLHQNEELWPLHLAGSSIGAVTAALIAGNPPEKRIERLQTFWGAIRIGPGLLGAPALEALAQSPLREAYNWLSVLQTRVLGRPGMFQLRLPELMLTRVTSLYNLAPLRANLERLVDFDRLNSGDIRVSIVTTDVATGEEVVFDTHRGDRIGPDHLLASCGFLPDFPPVEIDGRLLVDGGYVANAPMEAALLGAEGDDDLLCFVVDLFSADGGRPKSLEDAAARRWELMFGNQSLQRLKVLEREFQLRGALGRLAEELGPEVAQKPEVASLLSEAIRHRVVVLYLSYRPPPHEAGPQGPFDFSRASFADRWKLGSRDMAEAIRIVAEDTSREPGMVTHQVRRQDAPGKGGR